MNQKTLHTLEFDKILSLLEEKAVSAPGKALCRALTPMTELGAIETAQAETEAALSRIRMKGELRLAGLRDVSASVKRLDVGGTLSTSGITARTKRRSRIPTHSKPLSRRSPRSRKKSGN